LGCAAVNQPGLLQRCEHVAATTAPIAVDDSRNLARNRQEDRRVEVYAPGTALDDGEWGPLIAAIVRVTRFTLIRSAATGLWKWREEAAFYASSVVLPAEIFASAICGHWSVENENHWVRDVTLAEDASRIRVNPGVIPPSQGFADGCPVRNVTQGNPYANHQHRFDR
jgi:predicted transposase YbfD/YdcC